MILDELDNDGVPAFYSCASTCATLPAELIITGAPLICTSNTSFTLANVSSFPTITWQATPSNLFAVSSGTGSTAILKPASTSTNGQGKMTFTISNSCGTPITVEKNVSVYGSSPRPDGISGPNYDLCYSRTHANSTGNYSVRTPLPNITYTWEVLNSSTQVEFMGTGVTITLNGILFDPGAHTIRVRSFVCNQYSTWRSASLFVVDCEGGGGRSLSVYPNPASTELLISYPADSLQQANGVLTEAMEIALVNSKQEKVYSARTTNLTTIISIKNFPKGIYYLRIVHKEGILQKQIMIAH